MTVVARTASRIKKRENSFMLKLANASGSALGRKEARNHNRSGRPLCGCVTYFYLWTSDMAPRRRCPTCGSKQWHKEPSSGLIACSEGHILQVSGYTATLFSKMTTSKELQK